MRDAGRLGAGRADEHDLACVHRGFLHEDAALRSLDVRLRVALDLVDAFDDDFAFLRQGLDDLALLAFILAGEDDDRVAFLHVQFCE